MVQTRQRYSSLREERSNAQRRRPPISATTRAERLAITKAIAKEIVLTQDGLRGTRYGCRVRIMRKYSQIYNWLSKAQVDWHIKEIKKRSNTNSNNPNISNGSNDSSYLNNGLIVNDEPTNNINEDTNESCAMVSSKESYG